MCVFWRGVCGGASKFWLRWPSSRASWISNAALVSSPGNTIKGPINFQPEVWRSSGQHTHTHTHTHTLFSLTHDRGAVKGFDEQASRRGEQTDASSEHAGAIRGEMCRVASRWQTCGLHMKNFLDLPLLQLSKGTMTPRLQTMERFIQEVFLFIETLVALHSPNLQWQIPSHTWKWSKDSEPLWEADTNLPHLEFLFILYAAVPPEKSQKHSADIPELHMQRHPNAHPPPPFSPGAITWPRHYHCNVGLRAKIGHAVII